MDLEDKADELSYLVDDMREEFYLEFLFGLKSRLTYKEFMEVSTSSIKIYDLWYKSENLRALILHKLEVKQDDDKLAEFCRNADITL